MSSLWIIDKENEASEHIEPDMFDDMVKKQQEDMVKKQKEDAKENNKMVKKKSYTRWIKYCCW